MVDSAQEIRSPAGPAAALNSPRHEHVFNDDLLMNPNDLEYAKSRFPRIIHLLDYPQLWEKFALYEKEANEARDWVRCLGFVAVISAAIALLVVATKPIWEHAWPDTSWTRWIAMTIESAGILAALIAAGGMWLGPWKCKWLESRLMTERLRQWHFQLLVRRGQQVEASCNGPSDLAKFQTERAQWLADFLQTHESHLDSQLEALVDQAGPIGYWLHDPPTAYSRNSGALEHIFDAYQRLRFDHQHDYAVYKLRKTTDKPFWKFLKWPAICQMKIFSGMASACFIAALTCAAVLVYGHAFGLPGNMELYVRNGAVAIALIGAALRTIEGGLAPDKEIERYSDYRGRTSQLRDRFRQTKDAKERLRLMEEMELTAVDEMKGFLRTHYNTRFLLA